MDIKEYTALVDEKIDENWASMVELSDGIAASPEVSGQEFKTSRKIVDVLEAAGFDVEYPYLNIPTAFMAKAGRGGGAKVAVMVEYDALPEIGHACGHNLHGSMSVLAGISLLPFMNDIGGELLVVGTPAEETDGAKVVMAKEGVFDGCDFAIMIHCCCGETIIEYRSLAMDAIEFTFTGQTSHAASAPWEGRNALNGLQLFFHAIDMYRQHVKPDARMHGIVYNGGAAPNIVPEKAVGRFYFRAPKRAYLDKMLEQVYNCARGAALATNTEVKWRNFEASFMDVLPNQAAEEMLRDVFGEFGINPPRHEGFMGSSDVGDVTYRCPAVQPELDISSGVHYEGHTREMAEATLSESGHEALRTGAKIIARTALRVFLDPELRARLQADFKRELEAGRA